MNVVIGIDVGGSTTKIVGYTENLTPVGFLCVTAKDPVTSVYGALGRFVSENTLSLKDIAHIILTGVGASHFEGDIYNIATTRVTEFEAIGRGGLHLAGKDKALVVSMGTGTAFVRADKNEIKHIGGSGVGGGTLIGLCGKLAGCTNFDSIVTLANDADLQKVDLTVGDISKNSIGKLDAAVTASNFGKLEDSATGGDLALGVLNMVFQTVGMLAVFACENDTVKDIVATGMLTQAPQAKSVFELISKMKDVNIIIPEKAIYATAIGAALSYLRK